MSQNEKKRMIIKQGSGVPTVPASSDHTDGTWIATDLYDGELYKDINTGIVYIRDGSNIRTAEGTPVKKVYRATISQSGTSAPTEDAVLENTLSGSITWSYVSVGNYRGTLTGEFPDQSKFFALYSTSYGGALVEIFWVSANQFEVYTYIQSTGVLTNNALNKTALQIFVYE